MIEETVVHESLHVLDILSAAGRGAFEGLRSRLRAAGVIAPDPRLRDVSHGLIFIAAGEAIRRHLDPAHQHYGDTTGLYARLGLSAQCTRQPWVEYLDGDLDREAALDRAIEILLGDAASR